MTGIYKITCKASGQCYIGQAKNIEGRWKRHHKRFSPDAYDYEVLRIVNIPQFMNVFEKHYIKLFDSHLNGFNLTIGGTGIRARYRAPISDTTRARLAQAATGKTPSVEARAKMSASHKGKTSPNKGKTFSVEWCAKLSEAQGKRQAKYREERS